MRGAIAVGLGWIGRRERVGRTTYGQRFGIDPVLDQGDAVRELLAVEVRILAR